MINDFERFEYLEYIYVKSIAPGYIEMRFKSLFSRSWDEYQLEIAADWIRNLKNGEQESS